MPLTEKEHTHLRVADNQVERAIGHVKRALVEHKEYNESSWAIVNQLDAARKTISGIALYDDEAQETLQEMLLQET